MMAVTLADVVRIDHRFHRSVSLAGDWNNLKLVRSYLLTPTAKDLAERIAKGLSADVGPRAWAVTGPFGSGKSAFGVFLIDALCRARPVHPEAKAIRKAARLKGASTPVVVTGRRVRLSNAVLEAIAEAFPELADRIEAAASGAAIDGADVLDIVGEAIRAAKDRDSRGLVLVIDEFGKLLEHAARHPQDDELFLLQGLAELAARSPDELLLCTIQHAAFGDYLDMADPVRGSDWRKVQGRFVEETFFLPTEQFVSLIDAAVVADLPVEVKVGYDRDASDALASPALAEALKRAQLREPLLGCVPIHPVVALVLWPLFRSKLAQNERSLFAFLGSSEPSGFRDFLGRAAILSGAPQFFRLPDLYDYVMQSVGRMALTGDRSRYWAEAEGALARLPLDAPDADRDLIKSIALLSLFGPSVGLRPDRDTLAVALGDGAAVDASLDRLRQRSILIYRRHSDDFGIWQGSDFDIEAALAPLRAKADAGSPAERVAAVVQPPPRLALRHYAQEGTPRFFTVDLIEWRDGDRWLENPANAKADGRIAYVLTESDASHRAASEWIERQQGVDALGKPVIFALPERFVGLSSAATELAAWNALAEDPTLRHDAVARGEVLAGRAAARERLERLAGSVLGLPGYRFDPAASVWFHGGRQQEMSTSRQFAERLSAILNDAYPAAPKIFNELINRESLTSAAAKARRNLIEAMLTNGDKPRLGLTGFPPEASIYDSLLHRYGFHRRLDDGGYVFAKPVSREWEGVWGAIDAFLADSERTALPVSDLYARLQAPPYGMRMGPLPVVLAAALLERGANVAFYEEGVYLPAPGIELWERLLRKPEDVALRLIGEESASAEALKEIAAPLGRRSVPLESAPLLMTTVMPVLSAVSQLNPYARHTRAVSSDAIAIRLAASRAKDPHEFLLSELPEAFGLDLSRKGDSAVLGQRIQAALEELENSYSSLLREIEQRVALELASDGSPEAMDDIMRRSQRLVDVAGDPTLRALVAALARLRPGDWREEVGRVVNGGKPPAHWRDGDLQQFRTRFQQLAREIGRLEEMLMERGEQTGATVLRVGLLDGSAREVRRIVRRSGEQADDLARLVDDVVRLVRGAGDGVDPELAMTALAHAIVRLADEHQEAEEIRR